jgi:hypothetical protein
MFSSALAQKMDFLINGYFEVLVVDRSLARTAANPMDCAQIEIVHRLKIQAPKLARIIFQEKYSLCTALGYSSRRNSLLCRNPETLNGSLQHPWARLGRRAREGRNQECSLKWHSDKNPDPEAKRVFVMIAKAHKILSGDKTRKLFERLGTPSYLPLKKESGFWITIFLVVLVFSVARDRAIRLNHKKGRLLRSFNLNIIWRYMQAAFLRCLAFFVEYRIILFCIRKFVLMCLQIYFGLKYDYNL